MNRNLLGLAVALASFSSGAFAEVYITPLVGYGMGGTFEDAEGNDADIDNALAYGIAIETDVQKGRLGLLYSQQDSDVTINGLNLDSTVRYLHFQSAVFSEFRENWGAYFGLSVGGTQIDIQRVDTEYKFSAGVYTGLEYKFTDNFALQGQLRYLGTLVDSDSISYCEGDSSSTSCQFFFKSDWMSQFQANLGLTFSF